MKFDYGDVVVISEAAASDPRAGQPRVVVAITLIETEEQARHFGYPVGTTIYIVECEGRSDALVPEGFLRPI